MIAEVAITMITLHMIDGRVVRLNEQQITQLVEPRAHGSQLPEEVNCIVRLTDGSYVSVAETCDAVRAAME